MGGRAALIMVIGFAVIFGYMNYNMAKLSNRAVENMVGYNDITASRNIANTGANIGLAKLYMDKTLSGTIASHTYTSGPLKGSSYVVTTQYNAADSTLLMTSVSNYKTVFQTVSGNPLTLSDTVEVAFDAHKDPAFCYYGWLTNLERGVYFITGDTLDGRVHSNDSINISGRPVFKQKVTTSRSFYPAISTPARPTSNKAIFEKGYETGVANIKFPSDLSQLGDHAVNTTSSSTTPPYDTRNCELWVELKQGLSGTNDDGYALVRIAPSGSPVYPNYIKGDAGFTGTVVDSIPLSGTTDPVIFSNYNIHVMGNCDGRLSICSNSNLTVEKDIKYEESPFVNSHTDDCLGLVAKNNVEVSTAITTPGVHINASIFCLEGSFTAQNYGGRSVDGYINIIGSITQNLRGAVGTFDSHSGTINHGFLKNYKFDPRMADGNFSPPYYPGATYQTLHIVNWWESIRMPTYF